MHQKSPPRILIGFGEALAAPEVAYSLLEAGYRVCGFTRRGTRPCLRKCKQVDIMEISPPEIDVQETVSDIKRCLNTGLFAAVMPLDDASIWVCDRACQRTSSIVIGPTGRQAQMAIDKKLQLEMAAGSGIPTPPTRLLCTIEQLLSLKHFPLILKPAMAIESSQGGLRKRRSYACSNPDELGGCIKNWDQKYPLLAQPLLSGDGEGIFGFATQDAVYGWSAHRRIRMVDPAGSGASACTNKPLDEHLVTLAEKMIIDAQWRGMFMIELLRDNSGEAWFMEFNGRPWGSMALARKMGYEYPAWACQQAFDSNFLPPKVSVRPNVVCRHLGREILHLLKVIRGPRSKALITTWPSRWKTVREVLRVRDVDRWYNWRRGEGRLFWDDTYQTVRNAIFRRMRLI